MHSLCCVACVCAGNQAIWELLQLGFCCYCCLSKKDRKFEHKRPRIEKMYCAYRDHSCSDCVCLRSLSCCVTVVRLACRAAVSQTITDKLLEKTSGERGFYIGGGVLSLGFIACVMALWRYSTNFESQLWNPVLVLLHSTQTGALCNF